MWFIKTVSILGTKYVQKYYPVYPTFLQTCVLFTLEFRSWSFEIHGMDKNFLVSTEVSCSPERSPVLMGSSTNFIQCVFL